MGDARFDPHYKLVREADEPARVIAGMSDEDIVAALAAASRDHDPYLANVLASEAQNRLKRATALARHLGEGAIATDALGRITQVNPAAELAVGLPAERLLRRHIHDVLHPDGGYPLHESADDCPLLECMRGLETIRREDDRFSREDGTPIQVAYTASPIVGEDGEEAVGAVIVFQDIAERKVALAKIKEQQQTIEQVARNALRELNRRKRAEAIFRSLVNAAPDAQLIVDRSGRIATANPKAAQVFRGESVLEGGNVEDLLPGVLSRVRAALDDFQTGAFEQVACRRDGTPFPAEITTGIVSPEGEQLVVLAVRDVAPRKRAEDARARLAAIVHGSQDAIIGLSLDGAITSWNAAAERLYGYAEDDVTGMPCDVLVPPDFSHEPPRLREAIREGRSVESFETTRIARDGRRIPVSIALWPVRDASGAITGSATIHRDLTEVVAARERLEETSALLMRIFETTHVMVAYLDRDLRFVRANRAYAEVVGKAPDELLGRGYLDIHQDAETRSVLERVLATGRSHHEDARAVTMPGRPIRGAAHVDWAAQPVRDAGGVVRGLLLTLLDVTARVRAEGALRESEERFRLVFEQGPLGIAIVRSDFRFVEVNEALCRITGYPRHELLGKTFAEITHEEDVDKDAVLADRLFAGDIPSYDIEKRYVTKEGLVRWVHLTGTVVRDASGRPMYALGVVEDIRERKRAETALREGEARFRALLESAPDAMVIADAEGVIRIANAQVERLFGHTKADLVGQPVEMLLPEAARERHASYHRARYREDAHTRPMGSGLTVEGRRADGTVFPVEVSLSPIRVGDEMLVAAAIRDATERQRLAEDAARTADRLTAYAERLLSEKAELEALIDAAAHEAAAPLRELQEDLRALAPEAGSASARRRMERARAAALTLEEAMGILEAAGRPARPWASGVEGSGVTENIKHQEAHR